MRLGLDSRILTTTQDVVIFAASFVHFDGNFSTHDAALADGYNPGR